MKRIMILSILSLLFLPITGKTDQVEEYKLENGLKVLIIEENKAPLATFQVWYRIGSRNEPAGKSGLSHLLEHMMFKGTEKYEKAEFSKIIQKNGGVYNAYTTKDYTAYFEILSSDRIFLAIDLESDRMEHLIIDPKEMLSEQSVVMEERRLRYEDNPQNSLFEEVVAAAFKVHPYQRPVIGWMSEIDSIKRDDLYNYYQTQYTPDNAVVIIVGDVNAAKIIEKVKETFKNIPARSSRKEITSVEPEQQGERRVILKREAELPHIIIAYHIPNFPHEDSYALDILSMILSGGKSSRLYKSLVYEDKIALSVSADYSGFKRDPYLFFFSATASPGIDINVVEKALYAKINEIITDIPSERELQKAKNQIESSFIMGQDSIYLQAIKYGTFEMLGDWRLIDRYLEGIRNVTSDDLLKVTKRYFTENNRTVGILIPTEKNDS